MIIFPWQGLVVYGSAYVDHNLDFIVEIHVILEKSVLPILVGETFNLVRDAYDQNNGNINQVWADVLND